MSHGWNTTILTSEEDVLWLLLDLEGKCWLSRGHSQCRDSLVPSIDRDGLKGLHGPRSYSVNAGASTSFGQRRASLLAGEEGALVDDFIALMVLRHHGVPTRLLDWSASPYVATHFAVSCHDELDGEIWSFRTRL